MLNAFLIPLLAIAAEPGTPVATDQLAPGVKIMSGDNAVDVEVGHAAPYYADFDGDGVKDLLVGQFGGGKLRIYHNAGTNTKPLFNDFKFFQAGGEDATVPYG